MVLTVFAGIAEFERELIHQRTSSGRVAAKARGVRFGRPPKLTPCCEHCGRPHGQRVFHLGDGRWWDRNRLCWRNGKGRRVRRPTEDLLARGAWTPVVLACAHLNHDPSNSALHQVAALCQRCHMIHDRPEHLRRRWMNAHYRRAFGDLFYGLYPLLGADWITPTPLSMLDDDRSLYAFPHVR